MTAFMDHDFMLLNETAKELYHGYAEKLPIIDYHCHLNIKDIFENKPIRTITELWLLGDHYKWRAMRANGISEQFITGSSTEYCKFLAFAETMPYAIGNPIYHWSHLELQRYFNVHEILNPKSATRIWKEVNMQLADGKHTPRFFIEKSNVYALCTTEDPADTLKYHNQLMENADFATKILPAYRPDNALSIEKTGWKNYIDKLSLASGIPIVCFDSLTHALAKRMDAFAQTGCIASDHSVESVPFAPVGIAQANFICRKALAGIPLSDIEIEAYKTELLLWLGQQYANRHWVMELHMNAMRNCNINAINRLGTSTGYDSVCDHQLALKLSALMNALEKNGKLPKMILFSLNDADNMVISTMLGNFNDDSFPSKIQMGAAWWFQDNADGIENQLRTLASEGLLARFIGMLTDSRSFLSYSRHEYFRRILCNLVGKWVDEGKYPNDKESLKMLIEGISFYNAKQYFGL